MFSLGHLVILLVVVLLWRSKDIPMMGENLSKTIKLFKRGLVGERLNRTSGHEVVKEEMRTPDDVLDPK